MAMQEDQPRAARELTPRELIDRGRAEVRALQRDTAAFRAEARRRAQRLDRSANEFGALLDGLGDRLDRSEAPSTVTPEPTPSEPTPPEPTPPFEFPQAISVDATRGGLLIEIQDGASGAYPEVADVRGTGLRSPFVRTFVTEAGGVRETVVVLHNGNPRGLGMLRIPKLSVVARNALITRELNDWPGEIPIEPGGMLVLRDYLGLTDRTKNASEIDKMRSFWMALADRRRSTLTARQLNARPWQNDKRIRDLLGKDLARRVLEPTLVGPYDVFWDKEGYGHGGQGICPYRFEWRRCPEGYALAAVEMYGVANRTNRCMTDTAGAFSFDVSKPFSTVGDFMPDDFEATPDDPVEILLRQWKNIDGQHFERAYLAALFIYRETGHEFALWYLGMLAHFQYAAHLFTGGDHLTSHWWSLSKKIENASGPNQWGGRQGAHELRFACEWLRIAAELVPQDNGVRHAFASELREKYVELFVRSADVDGVTFSAKASNFTSKFFPKSWGVDPAAQAFELQLACLAMRDSGDSRLFSASERLADFLGVSPPYSYNWKTGERLGKANPYFELSTHNYYRDGDADELIRVAKIRMEGGGAEAGGANPLNYLAPNSLSKVVGP